MGRSLALFLVAVLLTVGAVCSDDTSPTITIAQGTLVGHIYNTSYGSFYAFHGIPFAKPPVGELRFKTPVAPEPWNGTFQATKQHLECIQNNKASGTPTGEEDCLYLNVFTPQLPDPNNLLPVMVWIHGGGYYGGSSTVSGHGPAFLLNDGVIYVSISYRLAALGFLTTQDEAAPGNAGMKDQVMALRWVQQNIAAFGGDPEKVTIFGQSAGGASVSLHVISPMSAGLFRAAISESGSAANPWSLKEQSTARDTAFYLGNALGFTGNSTQELVDFLRTVSAEDLVATATNDIPEADRYRLTSAVYPPVVEPVVDGEEAFLPDNPITLLAEGKFNQVPVLAGSNSAEGITIGGHGMLDGTVPPAVIEKNFTKIFKPELRYCKTDPCGDELLAKIKYFYFGNESITSDNLEKLIELDTDLMYAEGVVYAVKKLSALGNNPVYLYEFSYDSPLSGKSKIPGATNYSGVSHAGEQVFLFDNGVVSEPGSTDALVRYEMPRMWTNFAKTLNPTPGTDDDLPTWLPYTSNATYYMDIDAELKLKTGFHKERMDFWGELYGY